jgi:hypothetical protein
MKPGARADAALSATVVRFGIDVFMRLLGIVIFLKADDRYLIHKFPDRFGSNLLRIFPGSAEWIFHVRILDFSPSPSKHKQTLFKDYSKTLPHHHFHLCIDKFFENLSMNA